MSADDDPASSAQRPTYVERPRGFLQSLMLLGVFVAGFVVDVLLGAGRSHVAGWVIAALVVVGVDVLVVWAARSLHTITVTTSAVQVGDDRIERATITGVATEFSESARVLGRTPGTGLPRGIPGLSLELDDGGHVLLATRHPARLSAALAVTEPAREARRATPGDLPLLPDIDRRAESLFRVAGYDLPEVPFGDLSRAAAVFVLGDPPVGYVRIDRVDGLAHVQGLAVIPGHMRRGIGTALLAAACGWARSQGLPAITLTTFADVPWNAPFFTARGFVVADVITPGLAKLREDERSSGLDAVGRRVVMRCELTS